MLKWAVNCPRQSYLQNDNDNNLHFPVTPGWPSNQPRHRLKRKSSDLGNVRSKDNQYTSTPLHSANSYFLESASHKMDSLQDLSNVLPVLTLNTQALETSASATQTPKNFPNNYASTLPTFDVEYSPCALIPGPLLALRGVGIPDSYFEKPRYLTAHKKEWYVDEELPLEAKKLQQPVECVSKYSSYMEESTLSSTKMGDVTLEHMIDAILESNRKEIKLPKLQKQISQENSDMSPTYTPAEDPATDLHEEWDAEKSRYTQKKQARAILAQGSMCNEREVTFPKLQQTLDPGQLRRQRCLRRKRKITQITAIVMSSAQKFLSKGAQMQTPSMDANKVPRGLETQLRHDEIYPFKVFRNLSPDSGHNSSSEYEEDDDDCSLESMFDDNNPLNNTKRRLNFSSQNLNKT